MKIALLIVATGKYTQFLPGLLESAEQHFLKGHDVRYCIFTNSTTICKEVERITPYYGIFPIEHKPWPWATLKRFHFFQQHRDNMPDADYFFYVDADTLFKAEVTSEILGERVAVQHCGYLGGGAPYERRQESTCCVYPNEGGKYYGGGFWGFSKNEFWPLVETAVSYIDQDEGNGIVPVWHDESFLNRYLIDNPPTKELSPAFHWPEDNPHIYKVWQKLGVWFPCKLLLLNKNHKEIRA